MHNLDMPKNEAYLSIMRNNAEWMIFMNTKIRVLAIAPYESMKTQIERAAQDYSNIELDIYVGDLEQGVKLALSHYHSNYDAILSRGGTAKLIQERISLPVVEIEISLYDILFAFKLSQPSEGRAAIVGFSNITKNAHLLCELMEYQLDIFTLEDAAMAEPIMRHLQTSGYTTVICDMIANTTAQRLGLHTFLIASGAESIRSSLDEVQRICASYHSLRKENRFLRDIIFKQDTETVVFTETGDLFFSTLPDDDSAQGILKMLLSEISETIDDTRHKILRNKKGNSYTIYAQRFLTDARTYIAFFFSVRKAPLSTARCGMHFLTRREVENTFYSGLYSISSIAKKLQPSIDNMNGKTDPIMITGETGTGKEQVMSCLYLSSPLKSRPLITINCALLNDKTWDFLMNSSNSPLSDADNMLFFKGIDTLQAEMRKELLASLQAMEVCKRNRVVFSCTCSQGETSAPTAEEYVTQLSCLVLALPALREQAQSIPPLVNLYLSQLNPGLERQVAGVAPEGISLLQHYFWPHNFTQFKRLLNELAIMNTEPIISAADVRSALQREKNTISVSMQADGGLAPLDLTRTLSEIDHEIVLRVLEDTGGNQSATAKRLGISRTTLWRMTQS